jgi:MFS family permease
LNKPSVKLILGVAVFAYFVTVVERSSMGVASLSAISRFDVGATAISSLTVAQLVVYAAMQIPTGMLLDRFGAKRLIVIGSFTTGIGNLVVAVASVMAWAVFGRMIVGLGDALIFVSMIRLINGWLPGPRATRYTQLFANIGQLGQIASAVPFAYILGYSGWTPAFTLAAGLAFIAGALGVLYLRDEPKSDVQPPRKPFAEQFRENIGDPITRKAFWVHFTSQSSGSVFILLWGYPFMVQAEGIDRPIASALLTSFVFIGFLVGPILSALCVRHPRQRHLIVVGLYSLILCAWLLVLFTPGRNPLWQIVLLVLAIGLGGPVSMVAFDYSRTAIPLYRLGSSNGIINSGGFVATFTSMFLIGLSLDLIHSSGLLGSAPLYSLESFKLAFPSGLFVISMGLIFFMIERKKSMMAQLKIDTFTRETSGEE